MRSNYGHENILSSTFHAKESKALLQAGLCLDKASSTPRTLTMLTRITHTRVGDVCISRQRQREFNILNSF